MAMNDGIPFPWTRPIALVIILIVVPWRSQYQSVSAETSGMDSGVDEHREKSEGAEMDEEGEDGTGMEGGMGGTGEGTGSGETEMRDLDVLICVILGWISIYLIPKYWTRIKKWWCCRWFFGSRGPALENTDVEDEHLFESMPSLWLHASPHRNLDHFVDREAPNWPDCSFQLKYVTTRRSLYGHFGDTVIHGVWRFVIVIGLISVSLSWWLRFAPVLYKKYGYSFFQPDVVNANMGACHGIHSIVLPLASFMLSLYMNYRVQAYFRVMSFAQQAEMQLQDIALLIGACLCPHRYHPAVCELMYAVYRHLNLAHFYMYRSVCSRLREGIEDEHLVGSGFLLEYEADALSNSHNKKNTVLLWLSLELQRIINLGLVDPWFAVNIMGSLKGLRGFSSSLNKEVNRRVPISFSQLIQFMIDGTNMLTPPALAFAFKSDHDGLSVYLWPALGSMIIAVFYQGGLRMVQALEDPFGEDSDDLNPDYQLASGDVLSFNYLTCKVQPLPELLKGLVPNFGDSEEEYPMAHPNSLSHVHLSHADTLQSKDADKSARGMHGAFFKGKQVNLDGPGHRKGTREFGQGQNSQEQYDNQSNGGSQYSAYGSNSYADDAYSDQHSYRRDREDRSRNEPKRRGEARHHAIPPSDVSEYSNPQDFEGFYNGPVPTKGRTESDMGEVLPMVLPLVLEESALQRIEDMLGKQLQRLRKAKDMAFAAVHARNALSPESLEGTQKQAAIQAQTEKVVLDLVSKFHQELRSVADLRSKLAEAYQSPSVGVEPSPPSDASFTSSQKASPPESPKQTNAQATLRRVPLGNVGRPVGSKMVPIQEDPTQEEEDGPIMRPSAMLPFKNPEN